MNLEIHLHLNSELASNEFLAEFALNLHLKSESRGLPSGLDLVRLSREQATVGKTHASMSVEGHALPLYPLILKWLHPHSLHPPPPHTQPPLPPPHPVFPSSPVSSPVCGDEV